MPDSILPEAEKNFPHGEEPKDLHKQELDHKEGNTHGPLGNPVHPDAHPQHGTHNT